MTEAMYYILLAVLEPNHGYQLMQAVGTVSHGRVKMGPGTLYGVLTRMVKDGLIVVVNNDGRRKTYAITDAGKEALKQEFARLEAMIRDSIEMGL